MTARAPSESQSQQQLSWDNEGRLTAWQNAPTSPTSTAQYLYDGEGNRVEQQVTTGGTTTTTVYAGALEQVATTGATTTTTTYYYAAGQRIALAVNGTLSYLASDLLGSATVALDGSGTPTASQLYAPYGTTRYTNGVMPTDYGFTGQRADVATGLDYYGARYYDPTLGQFTSADTVMDGLNRYAYVGGNPISHTDPSGHEEELESELMGGAGGFASTAGTVGGGGGLAGVVNAIFDWVFGPVAVAGVATAASAGVPDTISSTSIPLAGTPDPATTFTVNKATIAVSALGDLEVTKYRAGYAPSTETYAVGSAGWLEWTHTVDVYYSTSDVWNARTAPKATTSTTTTTHNGGGPQGGPQGSAGSGGSWGTEGTPANPGVQIPVTTPPIGITAGIDIGITSIYVGGTLAIEWLFGTLYAKKADLKQLRAAARQAGITDEVDFREFGDWLEQDEKHGEGRGGKDHYSFNELIQLAKDWLELYK